MRDLSVAWATVIALSLVVMAVVEVLKKSLDPNRRWPALVWAVAALVVGIAVALIWGIDAIQASPPKGALEGVSGEILTGVLACGGATVAHGVTGGIYAARDRAKGKRST